MSTTPSPARFDSLGLAGPIVSAVTALGYEEPTPIQREAIPVLLAGKDLIGQAGTGTGKTAAFALPLLHRLLEASTASSHQPALSGRGESKGPRGVILVPTRELAMQVAEAVHKYAKGTALRVVPVYGGAPMDQQIRALRRGVDVVVATPGRALDLTRRQALVLDAVAVLVLDEADEMLDMGFAEDLEAILTATPGTRQTALFAATMAPRIAKIAERHLTAPARVMIKGEKRAAGKLPRVRQVAFIASRAHKAYALGRVLEFEEPASAIVFCRTRLEVEELTETLKSHGYDAQALHGGMEQRERDRVMALFRKEKADVLVATDVAARGLDIDHISHVINYDIPTSPEVYVHRIGRTGRIGREGVAITLVDPREQRMLRQIEGLTRQPIEVAPLPTEAALQAKRLGAMRSAIEERIKAGALDGPRAFVADLAHHVDVLDIAAAAVWLLQAKDEPAEDERDAPPPRDVEEKRAAAGPMIRLFVGAGRSAGIRPGDLVGAITNEAHLRSHQLGKITIGPHHALVEIPEALADRVIRALQKTTLKGRKVDVRLSKFPDDVDPNRSPGRHQRRHQRDARDDSERD